MSGCENKDTESVQDLDDVKIEKQSSTRSFNGKEFIASTEWQEIQDGQRVPSGLHYRMNLATGKKEAKILDEQEDMDNDAAAAKNAPVPVDNPNDDAEEIQPLDDKTAKQIRKNMERLKMNRDVEHIQALMANYGNASELAVKVAILEDLDYYMHQVDNARDFVTLGGLTHVVKPSLISSETQVAEKATLLLGSAAQYNPSVQKAILEVKLIPLLIDLLSRPESDLCCHTLKSRTVYAMAALVRGNPTSLREFFASGGFDAVMRKVLLDDDHERTQIRLKLKALSFVADVLLENSADNETGDILEAEDVTNICTVFLSDDRFYRERKYPFAEGDSLAWIQQVISTLKVFSQNCTSVWKTNKRDFEKMEAWLQDSEKFLVSQLQEAEEEEDSDTKEYLEEINQNIALVLRGSNGLASERNQSTEEL